MSTFGKFGSFIRTVAEGFSEIICLPFQGPQPASTPRAALDPAAHSADAPMAPGEPASPETLTPSEAAEQGPADAAKGRILSIKPYGPEFPASAVTRRYRALKAEGLTPKQASEFSHSQKKYARYKILSTTRPFDGAETYWDKLKDFDHKAEAHLQMLKETAVLKQDVAILKLEIKRARDLLIQKFIDGKDTLTADNFALVKKVVETIDVKYL